MVQLSTEPVEQPGGGVKQAYALDQLPLNKPGRIMLKADGLYFVPDDDPDDGLSAALGVDAPAALTALGASSAAQAVFASPVRFYSGEITVLDDSVGAIPTPFAGGFVLILHNSPIFPQVNESAILAYDTGDSLSLTSIFLGNLVQNAGSTLLTGTTGTDAHHTVAVQAGQIQIENRRWPSVTYSYAFVG